jgi:hypothetical protein
LRLGETGHDDQTSSPHQAAENEKARKIQAKQPTALFLDLVQNDNTLLTLVAAEMPFRIRKQRKRVRPEAASFGQKFGGGFVVVVGHYGALDVPPCTTAMGRWPLFLDLG